MIIIILFVAFGVVGYYLGKSVGRPEAGLAYGLLLGPIGWIVVLCFKDDRFVEDKRLRKAQEREDRILANRYLADQWRKNQRP